MWSPTNQFSNNKYDKKVELTAMNFASVTGVIDATFVTSGRSEDGESSGKDDDEFGEHCVEES